MHFEHIVSTVACCSLIVFGYALPEQTTEGDGSKKEEEIEEYDGYNFNNIFDEDHTFVTLIDVVFQDESKRTCTGSIIHDNVVITAAHCFVHKTNAHIQPELTASFVVIGTKKMYEAGYEQYLPIERILTHPKFHNWTADLSLVYTFAAMTADKPGIIIRLSGNKMANQMDSNITVYSWGHGTRDKEYQGNDKLNLDPQAKVASCSSSIEEKGHTPARFDKYYSYEERPRYTQPPNLYPDYKDSNIQSQPNKVLYKYPSLQNNMQRSRPLQVNKLKRRDPVLTTNKPISKYLNSEETSVQEEDIAVIFVAGNDENLPSSKSNMTKMAYPRVPSSRHYTLKRKTSVKRMFRNWRRSMGTQENKLTVNTFTFINKGRCKRVVQAAPSSYLEFQNGEVACYTSEDYYITDDDSGAPVVKHGELVAVTVGGAKCDGVHVGVGLKISCYCTWIFANLPGKLYMNCCKNCCEVNHANIERKRLKQDKTKYAWQ